MSCDLRFSFEVFADPGEERRVLQETLARVVDRIVFSETASMLQRAAASAYAEAREHRGDEHSEIRALIAAEISLRERRLRGVE